MNWKLLRYFAVPYLLLLSVVSHGQGYEIKGRIQGIDSSNSESSTILGATVFHKASGTGTVTDANGEFLLTIPSDTATLQISYPGFTTKFIRLRLNGDTTIRVELVSKQIKEVVITDERDDPLNRSSMSLEQLTVEESDKIVGFMGENDIIRTLQLKPGVSSAGEGFSGLYVRGGGNDQNLFLYDGAVLYNPNHLLGFFSTFNPDAVSSVNLYKSSFPPEFGGRLSSIVDVESNTGNMDSTIFKVGVGMLASRFSVQGPIKKNKISYLIGGRRTYFDVFTRAWNRLNREDPEYVEIPSYNFYDLNGNLRYDINKEHRLTLSSYFGRDAFGYTDRNFEFTFRWGNTAAILAHDWVPNSKWIISNNLSFSDYRYRIGIKSLGLQEFNIGAGISSLNMQNKADVFLSENSVLTFGLENGISRFDVGTVRASGVGIEDDEVDPNFIFAGTHAVFVSVATDWNSRLKSMVGTRVSSIYRDSKFFGGTEPRFRVEYLAHENVVLKGGYARMFQYVHLASNSGASLPTDIWYPSGKGINPQRSDQLAAGWEYFFGQNRVFRFSNEYYYKWFDNLIDFKDGADLVAGTDLDEEFVFGKGWAYGIELYLEKKKGKLTGWIGYTLAWSWREFPEINEGELFHPRYDRRHDLSIVMNYELNDHWSLSTTWVYGSGNLMTLPTSYFPHQDVEGTNDVPPAVEFIPIYEERNNYRFRPYHRLDIGAKRKAVHKHYSSELSLGLFNVYDRRNPFFIYFENVQEEGQDGDQGFITGVQAKEVSLFPILPSVAYTITF